MPSKRVLRVSQENNQCCKQHLQHRLAVTSHRFEWKVISGIYIMSSVTDSGSLFAPMFVVKYRIPLIATYHRFALSSNWYHVCDICISVAVISAKRDFFSKFWQNFKVLLLNNTIHRFLVSSKMKEAFQSHFES